MTQMQFLKCQDKSGQFLRDHIRTCTHTSVENIGMFFKNGGGGKGGKETQNTGVRSLVESTL